MKKYMVIAVFAMIAIMALGMLNTGAWFTDNATSANNSISTGTLSIANGALSTATLGTIANLAPGEIIEKPITVVIRNDGNIPLAWFGNIHFDTLDAGLLDVLYIDNGTMAYSWVDNFYAEEGGEDKFIKDGVAFNADAAKDGWYNTLKDPKYGVITFSKFDDSSGMGTPPYEFMGALEPGEYYTLTLKVGMIGHEDIDDAYQNRGPVNISFSVGATQINAGALEAFEPTFSNHLTWLNNQLLKQP